MSKTKNLSAKVLSARVTPDVYMAWQNMANSKGLSVSECLRDAVTMLDKKPVFKKPVLKAAFKEKKVSEFKVLIESKKLKLGDVSFEEPNIIISVIGNQIDIRSGIFKAMIADESFAHHILHAADHYLRNKK
jgi:hypothetical protein